MSTSPLVNLLMSIFRVASPLTSVRPDSSSASVVCSVVNPSIFVCPAVDPLMSVCPIVDPLSSVCPVIKFFMPVCPKINMLNRKRPMSSS